MKGFFSSSKYTSKNQTQRMSRCGICGLYKTCKSPRMPYTGEGRKKILVVAEAPGEMEDQKGVQLIGKAGMRLRKSLKKLDIDLDKDCWKTNAVICRPPNNITPDSDKIEACRPNLLRVINELQPNVIILLGYVSVKSLIGYLWKEDVGSITRWVGWSIPCQKLNSWIIPTYHPSYLIRKNSSVLDILFDKHLKLAIRKRKNKPWKRIPDYRREVEIIINPLQAVKCVREMRGRKGPIAFDYETNCLKPDSKKAKIVSCSISNGEKTIAFPMQERVIDSISKLLESPVPKIASNMKFEDRWTRAKLGHPVKNWYWDTMLASHVLDNRSGITSIKFQAFVLLGQESYDDHIKPFLSSERGSEYNRIHQVDIKDLLLYNGLDSLLEYTVAEKQIKEFNERSMK